MKHGRELSKKKLLCVIVLAIIIVSVTFIYFSQNSSPTDQLKAAIIEPQGSATFNKDMTNILEEAGYTVDFHIGKDVSVGFYKSLPTGGYRIIVIITHSTSGSIYTDERYKKSKYVYEQLTGQLLEVTYDYQSYFAITSSFVENSMNGRFKNSTIMMMGCSGLMTTDMAEAFVERGARAYIAWRQSVLTDYTDKATVLLLEHLITERKTIEQAVTETMEEMGPYPILAYYPSEAGDEQV